MKSIRVYKIEIWFRFLYHEEEIIMENRKVRMNNATNLLELEEHMYP